ncbi:MAG: FHA domain-containing protein [Inquilinus sp.]|nr:FHA domain-containing protein [Inquilinus sp.]
MRRSYVVGRSPYADVVLADGSVARRHAEIVVTGDGRLYLTDCGSEAGTWRLAEGSDDRWERVRQDFIGAEEPLRVGEFRCTAATLLGDRLDRSTEAQGGGRWRHEGLGGGRRGGGAEPPRGRVERDPETGEIIPKRL